MPPLGDYAHYHIAKGPALTAVAAQLNLYVRIPKRVRHDLCIFIYICFAYKTGYIIKWN